MTGAALTITLVAGCSPGPVAVGPPTPTGAARSGCARLAGQLPATLEGMSSRTTRPHSSLTHAWGKPPVVLRCGVVRPAGVAGAELTVVNGVQWFQRSSQSTVTWIALRPHVCVELSVPTSYQGQAAFLVDLAGALKRALP